MAGNIEDESSEIKKMCIEKMRLRRFKFKQKSKEYYNKRIVFRKNNDDFMTEHEIYITSSEEENEIQFKFSDKTGKNTSGKPKENTDQGNKGISLKK